LLILLVELVYKVFENFAVYPNVLVLTPVLTVVSFGLTTVRTGVTNELTGRVFKFLSTDTR